ncbi:MAG: hypothetical protein ACJA1B_001175 [Polaribacter sp.]|jgi:hypothetical protein
MTSFLTSKAENIDTVPRKNRKYTTNILIKFSYNRL